MRIFIDTEFVQGKRGPVFLSAAFLTDGGHLLYSEMPLHEACAVLARNPNRFVLQHVISQFGIKPSETWAELPAHLKNWLTGLNVPEAEVIYDYNLDFLLVEQLLARMDVPPAIHLHPTHVGYLADDPEGKAAAEACWHALKVVEGISQHHALADVYALRLKFLAVHGVCNEDQRENPFPIGEPFELPAVITAVVEEFEVVHAETSEGRTLSIGADTRGIPWRELREGQEVVCECLASPAVRVVGVRLVDPGHDSTSCDAG